MRENDRNVDVGPRSGVGRPLLGRLEEVPGRMFVGTSKLTNGTVGVVDAVRIIDA